LLAKKNELFSNVSHEFRTPLTLILGPINELLNKQAELEDSKSLGMIKRNANRLLSLVEQLLQIARVSDFKKIKTTPQNVQIQLQSLIDSFQHMAQSKAINLQLVQNEPATINVTDQFIDATMGNLVSNAIKYTQAGGTVIVSSKVSEDLLFMSVKDTGIGLTQEQQRDIFKRFKRLESHQLIEGIGIGLSVVEEVVKINNGIIKVDSELGLGSEFTVSIPQSDAKVVNESKSISTLVKQLQAESLQASLIPKAEQIYTEENNLNTVLVIEDNHDMREHIISIIGSQYNCIAAENGLKGVAAAIEHIPDIIISDVMMPEMDGFKVARIIRSDQRTSHIPLMLLTALHDKANRIKGWRENVDAYMTKPFDRDELLVQLENMLTIRDILKTKAGELVKQGQSITAALPKKDKEFIEKLLETIHLNYQDPIINRAKIASKMAVSDRQLQRKTKALIDQNPMDLLREFRLNKAKELLMDGYQVSQVSDHCGFNSLSYFSQCFKAQFGMSPKKYQQTT
jgi:CheY-like chemotaxis protein